MMRADFSRNGNPHLPCILYHHGTCTGGTVAQVQMHTGFSCQQDIPCSNHILHRIRNARKLKFRRFFIFIHTAAVHHVNIFTMSQHRNSQPFCCRHGILVQLCIHNGFSVLAYGRTAGFHHSFYIWQLLSLHAFGDRPHLQYMNRGKSRRLIVYIIYFRCLINSRPGIWHCENRRKTALCSRFWTCFNIFLIF